MKLYFSISGSIDNKILNCSFVWCLGYYALYGCKVGLVGLFVFSEWEKNGEGDWERRIGLLPQDAFLYRSIMYKNTHLIIVDLKVVSSKLILFVPVYALGGLHMNIAQFEDC